MAEAIDKKSKYVPSPEDIKLGTAYGFNLNLAPSVLKGQVFGTQYDCYVKRLKYFRHPDIELQVYPEISHQGKLHVHGIIVFNSYLSVSEFYLKLLEYPHHLYIHTIEDTNKRREYMLKSERIMRPLCDKWFKKYVIQIKMPKVKAPILSSFDTGVDKIKK